MCTVATCVATYRATCTVATCRATTLRAHRLDQRSARVVCVACRIGRNVERGGTSHQGQATGWTTAVWRRRSRAHIHHSDQFSVSSRLFVCLGQPGLPCRKQSHSTCSSIKFDAPRGGSASFRSSTSMLKTIMHGLIHATNRQPQWRPLARDGVASLQRISSKEESGAQASCSRCSEAGALRSAQPRRGLSPTPTSNRAAVTPWRRRHQCQRDCSHITTYQWTHWATTSGH
jgi:hypothetical protein